MSETNYAKMKEDFRKLLDAIPKGKYAAVMDHASGLELGMQDMARMLSDLRGYFLETTGEDSPFVKMIDGLVSRPKKGNKPQ